MSWPPGGGMGGPPGWGNMMGGQGHPNQSNPQQNQYQQYGQQGPPQQGMGPGYGNFPPAGAQPGGYPGFPPSQNYSQGYPGQGPPGGAAPPWGQPGMGHPGMGGYPPHGYPGAPPQGRNPVSQPNFAQQGKPHTHFCSVFRTDRKSDQNFELDKIEPISDDKCVLSLRPITDGDAAAATDAAESDPDLSTTTTSIFYGAKRIQPKC